MKFVFFKTKLFDYALDMKPMGFFAAPFVGVSSFILFNPVFANIIMRELDVAILEPFIKAKIVKFCCRCVDDTLLLIKPEDIDKIHHAFNSFDAIIQFKMFEHEVPHFLNLKMAPDGLSIF